MQAAGAPVSGLAEVTPRRTFLRRTMVHTGIFVASFVSTTGVAVLAVLLWVRPDSLVSLVLVGVLAAVVFVSCFATLRMVVLHRLLDEYPDREEDPGVSHHLAKSVAYALVALVIAAVLAGLIVRSAAGEESIEYAAGL